MGPMSEGNPDLQGPHSWLPDFSKAREPIQGYNEVYLEQLSNINPGTDDITLFTDAGDLGLLPNEEAELTLDFCRRIRTLESFEKLAHGRLISVVHDSDSNRRSRQTDYPLTPAKLLGVLSVPRLKPKTRVSDSKDLHEVAETNRRKKRRKRRTKKKNETQSAIEELDEVNLESQTGEPPEAKRRLIIIVNLDESVLWALIKTVSPNEAAALRSFVSGHLALKASLETTISGVLELRSEQAKREWERTIKRVLMRCDSKRNWYDERLEGSVDPAVGHDHETDDCTDKKSYSLWIHRVRRLLERLRRSLVKCIYAWDAFTEGDIRYFFASGKESRMTQTQSIQMVAIKKNFKQMVDSLQSLDMFRDELKDRMNELGSRLEYDNHERARAQIATAMDMKILTWVTFHSLPFTLVAGFMSARPDVLPFPDTLATPLITFCVIEAVIWFTLDRFFEGRHAMRYKDDVELASGASMNGQCG
ncbi:uncharacterized protein PG998_006088 [Apiospora kogelbergensis]|uniref:uncharacterized protein n=1 Tax=Apiospora kogelbergensis TaxID=1337665 RepID=UPI003130EFBF